MPLFILFHEVDTLKTSIEFRPLVASAMEFDHEAHLVGGVRIPQGVLIADFSALVVIKQGLVKGDHTLLTGLFHKFLKLMDLPLVYQVRGEGGAEKYLDPARMTIMVVGDKKTVEEQLEPYRAGVP